MIRKIINSGLLLVISCILFACTESPTKDSGVYDSTIIPLKVGNAWHYTKFSYRMSNPSDTSDTHEDILELTESANVSGIEWFKIGDEGYVTNRKSGYYGVNLTDLRYVKMEYASLLYKYPAQAGDVYLTNSTTKIKVENTNTSITTPAGTFKCIQYSISLLDVPEIEDSQVFICPDVGIVRSTIFYKMKVVNGKEEFFYRKTILNSYELK